MCKLLKFMIFQGSSKHAIFISMQIIFLIIHFSFYFQFTNDKNFF